MLLNICFLKARLHIEKFSSEVWLQCHVAFWFEMQLAAKMTPRVVTFVLCALGVFHKGLTALIQTQQTVRAAAGENALLNCQLIQSKDVLQVTWQKRFPEGMKKDIATNSKRFGQRVNPGFEEKVQFRDAGLQSSSIVIRNVTERDEGCYKCLFNTYPEGTFTGTTCLKLYELHEPVLHMRQSNSPEETVVSCSVTGRPAPTVTLRVLKHNVHLSNYSSVSVTNSNGTVTVTTTAVLSGFHDNSTQVGCAVSVLSGPQIERFMMIPEVKQTSADGSDFVSILVGIVAAYCAAAVMIICCVKKHGNRNPEENKTD